ncbi:glycosyltransferase [Daejeonella lutea]|uniref:UDP:flavonoid glycosyltransferase YjiC, YdhE family n=1 Tax=Daejeonella lutea TaxID=572036 RepID=A0A1T5AYI2_9SPHI|nr:glycosyltransferase [Daejeonella lutea]SKB39879.1 UDP:flavonoid glycosyltransferase YjiC, YdhE family [Daejeonella lutea]
MKVTLFTLGTRGDVQPFAVLGAALADRGYTVTLCTAENFRELVEGYNISFHPVGIDSETMINSEQGQQIMKVDLYNLKKNLNEVVYPIIKTSLSEFYKLAKTSDVIIYRTKTLADVFLDQLDCVAIRAAVVPAMEETSAFLNPIMSGLKIPSFLNKMSFRFNELRFRFFKKPLDQFRVEHGLVDVGSSSGDIPGIYGISPHFLDRPDDWSLNQHLTGFWFPPKKEYIEPRVERFISRGKAPLLITFGSMPVEKGLGDMLLRGMEKIDERFIVIKGWAEWEVEESEKLMVLSTANFDALFPRMKAIIHHGGIGTTAECLRSGKPMFICPPVYPFGDQFFWGELACKQGVAVKPVPLSQLNGKKFIKGVKELISDERLYQNSKRLAAKLAGEDGVKSAVELIEDIMNSHFAKRSA